MRNITKTWKSRRACLRGVVAMRALAPGLAMLPILVAPTIARAQDGGPTISYPKEGTALRGTVKVLFEGIPDGGNAMIYVDLTPTTRDRAFRSVVTNGVFNLDTFPLAEGRHSITIVTFSAAGKRLGESAVNFEVANSSVDPGAEAVRLVNWTLKDRVQGQVQRYRIEAESLATITGGSAAGGGGSSGGSPGGGSPGGGSSGGSSGGGAESIPAPLDWQVNMLVRRIVRDVGMYNNSANIKLNVKEAYQRQREDKASGGGGSTGRSGKKSKGGGGAPSKAPWGVWEPAPEVGQYFVKMITAAGVETNATRKPFTIALGDLLPLFPVEAVRPGSPWLTEITLVTELSMRQPLTVSIPMRFTSFETFQTPAGAARRCARLETGRQPLPPEIAMKIARVLQASAGTSAGGSSGGSSRGSSGGAGGSRPGGAGGGADAEPAEITVARSSVSRVLWFDVAAHRVLRSEDQVDTYYEEEAPEQTMSSAPPSFNPGGFGGFGSPGSSGSSSMSSASSAPAEPVTVDYNLRVVKLLDDTIPPPTDDFNAGVGTAHARDSVKEPSLARVTGRR